MRQTSGGRADAAFLTAVALGILLVVALGPLERRLELVRINDFSGYWAGGAALAAGADPYDPATWRGTVDRLGTQAPDTAVYGYTPWVAIAMRALAPLGLDAAAWLWMLGTVLAAIVAVRALLRELVPGEPLVHGGVGLAMFVSQPAFHSLVLGQWSYLLLAALAFVVLAIRRGHAAGAVIASLAFLAKPQLFVFTIVGIAWRALRGGDAAARRWVALAAALAGGVVVLTTLAMPHWVGAWLTHVAPVRVSRPATLPSALSDIAGAPGAVIGFALIAALVVLAARYPPRSDASLAAWLAVSSAGAIYSWSYDHLLLLVPIVLAGAALRDAGAARWRAIVLGALAVLVVISPALYAVAVLRHRESFSIAVPVLIAALILATLRPARSREVSDAGRP